MAENQQTMASFFAGIGGFDLGFKQVGVKTVFLCENNSYCQTVLSAHWPNIPLLGDINSVAPNDIPKARIWCGGFPCQDISLARGSKGREGLKGRRSGLFFRFAHLIEKQRPEVIVIENVAGLFNSNQGRDFGVILQTLTNLGYAVSWRMLNSRYFGVPQSRTRVYLCCWLNNPQKALLALFDVLNSEKPQDERNGFITEDNPIGIFPKVPKVSYCLAATSGRHTGTDWSRTYVVDQVGVRRLTPIESERLQGFPDNWTKLESQSNNDSLRYHAIGNAVTVPVIRWIANKILKQLENKDDVKSMSYEELKKISPDFKAAIWHLDELNRIDFSDTSLTHKWGKSGFAWGKSYIFSDAFPTPPQIIHSSLFSIIEKECNNDSYYLTPNAAAGILRRVDSQGRKLFLPLRNALEKLSANV